MSSLERRLEKLEAGIGAEQQEAAMLVQDRLPAPGGSRLV